LDGWVALLQGALLLKNMAWEEVRKVTDVALPNNRTRLVTFLRADLVLRDGSIFSDDWNTTVRGVAEWLSTRSPGLFASSYKASREECCPLELRWSYVHSVINHLPDSLRFAVFKSHDFPLHSRTVQLFAYGGGSAPIADLLSSDISKVVDSCAKIGVIEGHTFCIGGPQSCSEGDVRTAVAKFVLRWYALLCAMPHYAHIREETQVLVGRRLRDLYVEPPFAPEHILISGMSDLPATNAVQRDVTEVVKSLALPYKAPDIKHTLTRKDWKVLRKDGRHCSILIPLEGALEKPFFSAFNVSTLHTCSERMPVQGERGVGISAARPMKPALLAQYISGAHVKTVTGGRVLLVARGLPDRGPGLEAARRACQHLANDVIRFNILHNTREPKGDFKASHETVALFLEAGASICGCAQKSQRM
jgi:hypothetical protein